MLWKMLLFTHYFHLRIMSGLKKEELWIAQNPSLAYINVPGAFPDHPNKQSVKKNGDAAKWKIYLPD